jgi:hypothetical protein
LVGIDERAGAIHNTPRLPVLIADVARTGMLQPIFGQPEDGRIDVAKTARLFPNVTLGGVSVEVRGNGDVGLGHDSEVHYLTIFADVELTYLVGVNIRIVGEFQAKSYWK